MSKTTKKPIVVAVDLGTSKVCAMAGYLNEHNQIEVLGVSVIPNEGIIKGVVYNIEKTVKTVGEAIRQVERTIGQSIKHVHLNLSGKHIMSQRPPGMITRENGQLEINQEDIDKFINDMYKLVLPAGNKIIHVIPQEYTIDNEKGITDPIGMCGHRLEANFHIITGQISAYNNLERSINRAGLNMADLTASPIASAESVLTNEEKEAGVVLVDFGSGTTGVTIYKDNIIRHTGVIGFGSHNINKDIIKGCKVLGHQAEKLKVKYGSAMPEEIYNNFLINFNTPNQSSPKDISAKTLAFIIQSRLEEIFNFVAAHIQLSGYNDDLIAGMVLTGGGAMLKNIDKFCEYHLGMSCRLASPVGKLAHGYSELLRNPSFATSIGLLSLGIQNVENGNVKHINEVKQKNTLLDEKNPIKENTHNYENENQEEDSWYNGIFTKAKAWFEAEPDSEF